MGNKGLKATITDVSKRIVTPVNRTEGIINFDSDNAYPNRIIDIINSSGTGTLCTNMLGKYLYGEGFEDETLANIVVNKRGETGNKLLFKARKQVSRFNGISIHINYNMLFEKTSLHEMKFQDFRLTDSLEKNKHKNMLAFYDDWQKEKRNKIDHKKIEYFHFFNPSPAAIQKQVDSVGGWENYKGQVLYFTLEGLNQYTLAPSDSVLEDVQTDAHAKTFKNRNITTNFMASHIIETYEFEGETERQEFMDNLEGFQGHDNTSKFMLVERKAGEEGGSFKIHKIDIQDIEKLYEFTENSVRDNIIRNYLIPPILLMAVPGKLGSTSEIVEATASYNGTTREIRMAISEVFKDLFTNFHIPVTDNFNIIELSAPVVNAKDTTEGKKEIINLLSNSALSVDEKRALLLSVYDVKETDVDSLIPPKVSTGVEPAGATDEEAIARAKLRGSVGGATSILDVQKSFNENLISESQAIGVLELIFGLSKTDASRLIEKDNLNLTVTS